MVREITSPVSSRIGQYWIQMLLLGQLQVKLVVANTDLAYRIVWQKCGIPAHTFRDQQLQVLLDTSQNLLEAQY